MESLSCSSHPRTAYLEILYGCNLHCTYCYIGQELNHVKPLVPPLEKTLQILQILKKEDVEEVVLLGGEPLLHPHFDAICSAIANLGFRYRGVVTNGTAITADKANLLHETGFWVDISFRGPDANTFDALAGKSGSFQKALEAAKLLSSMHIPVGIEFDCVPENFDKLFDTIQLLVQNGVNIKQLQLHRIMPEGDAKGNIQRFFLDLDQWRAVFIQADRVRQEFGFSVVFEDGFPLCLVDEQFRDMVTPCPCGFTLLTVSPSGEVRYCPCHGETLGNVLHQPLKAIWENSLQGYRNLDRQYIACLQCDLLEVCRGGCSASGASNMSESLDVFHEYFRPIKLHSNSVTGPKLIMGQGVSTSSS